MTKTLYGKHLKMGDVYIRETGRGTATITPNEEGYLFEFVPFKRLANFHSAQNRMFEKEELANCLRYCQRVCGNPPTALHWIIEANGEKRRLHIEK
ncbi:hypothetical protein O2N63_13085 [Aliiroseovarius sp. KMU-50]|uniref:Uncharacterized protein n=1 Tax=Aliiroseovarius salicola TaxID=3009082 RepID=A0ABT4W3C5_9RHOB|nr:hypothetical protein [Aliiroseovarius sp. KMU-50]MDA5095018.1 hypothetical protein [Aliiroseovarius sp. KMU-50]